jgi:adenylyltransferase/sulfurtransferase
MKTELCKEESFDEDGYSAAAREDTSVRGVLSPSDWGGSTWSVQNAGGGADDSTVVARPNTPSEATANKDRHHHHHHHQSKKDKNKNGDKNFCQWWSDFLSRASRSATSLLNQHSPNLNDILDGNEENPLATVDQRPRVEPSIPEDNDDEVFALLEEVAMLKKRIEDMENEANLARNSTLRLLDSVEDIPSISPIQMLQPDQISRYSRQLLLNDGFGVSGQKQLLSSSILVVGAGGIGSTVLLYLAAAGVGHITVVDYDCVEMTNLHRQIIHKDSNASKGVVNGSNLLGMNKALSAKQAMLDLNPSISCTALDIMISGENALELVSKHDVIVDACDNPRTRYLLNDACILGGKPLVSGSAMGTEGQLTVYNYQSKSLENETKKKQTACYRCLYPNQVVSEGCKSCSDNGVLGPVPGIIGTLQAVEAIKVVTGIGNVMHDRLMMYDSLHCSFLNVKKPPAKRNCAVCSSDATIKSMKDSAESLEKVRGPSVCALSSSDGLSPEQNISCDDYNTVRTEGKPHVLLDVRVKRQYEMCSLEGSVNVPLEELASELDQVEKLSHGELPVYCLCRRGVASAEAVKILQNAKDDDSAKGIHSVYNISGGLNSWVANVDSSFPSY